MRSLVENRLKRKFENVFEDDIAINSKRTHQNKFANKNSKISCIEATNIKIVGCDVKNICGSEIVIGENCNVDYVYCTNKLFICPNSIVKNFE